MGLLRVAKRRGLIPAVKPVLNRLIGDASFRVAKPLYEQILQDAGE
ncbi:MAG: DUF3368 domain-containing protein [Cyanobacteriota bacterium]|nr:DUF3368 domain-containing protein [Cyanobacteriota bacterium]